MQTLKLILLELRLKQWLKNIVIFLPVIFVNQFLNLINLERLALGFVCLSLTAGSLYIINDIIDRDKDKIHPEKRFRPIASGRLSISMALASSLLIFLISGYLSFRLDYRFLIVLIIYAAIILAYSFYLKHRPIIDMGSIALGFVLRIIAGAILIDVRASSWILATTFFFAVFLVAAKRRLELRLLEHDARDHRPALDDYTPTFSNIILALNGGLTITSFTIYTLEESVVARLGTDRLIYSVPFVFVFVARMIFLAVEEQKYQTGDPTNLIIKDQTLLLSLFGWLATVLIIILWPF